MEKSKVQHEILNIQCKSSIVVTTITTLVDLDLELSECSFSPLFSILCVLS